MKKCLALLAAGLAFGAVAGAANAAVVNFNDNPDGIYWVPTVHSDGFTATSVADLGAMGTNYAIDGWGPSNGTVHLDAWTNEASDSIWTLTQTNGQAFSLTSFDFANGYTDGSNMVSSLTLTGLTTQGATVTQTFTPATGDFETFAVGGEFKDLSSVTFDAFGPGNRAAYDNLVVGTSAVPEPATWAMLILGLGMLGFAARRRTAGVALAA